MYLGKCTKCSEIALDSDNFVSKTAFQVCKDPFWSKEITNQDEVKPKPVVLTNITSEIKTKKQGLSTGIVALIVIAPIIGIIIVSLIAYCIIKNVQ